VVSIPPAPAVPRRCASRPLRSWGAPGRKKEKGDDDVSLPRAFRSLARPRAKLRLFLLRTTLGFALGFAFGLTFAFGFRLPLSCHYGSFLWTEEIPSAVAFRVDQPTLNECRSACRSTVAGIFAHGKGVSTKNYPLAPKFFRRGIPARVEFDSFRTWFDDRTLDRRSALVTIAR
jgi:hypothetical protein